MTAGASIKKVTEYKNQNTLFSSAEHVRLHHILLPIISDVRCILLRAGSHLYKTELKEKTLLSFNPHENILAAKAE